ncbi:TetR/AcrR family transcriptional regulator [Nocardia seriolae]|uniref:TetR family transcriptional regulator n=1 Tax=Nocardia seriolae TaxID=37332 RepID=A0ABC9YVG2_9NOCA|nr:TetR/AcrR family transcriptional regulator [Nocardia seriolae]APA97684.1 hypothetical protein NS506_03634 [Nocardia seriolae]OJF81402.1 hypothetical protein NS14008_22250 [Nocardia seriolae]PSK30102.1 TetR/AcrR family transcriptional regulator [Nocardia seriolae]QOW34595.1 TetR/AcrR family transcriptional regulator [Nocardia seriolae]QUN17943.1 TetR/AcrR family transcriptional regulator [Nocardia seriolae]
MRTKWGDREGRRRDILSAGRDRLSRFGYADLTMREVAQAAKISLGTVYTYFPSKEALFAACYAQRLDELMAAVAPACESETDPEELFVTIATEYLDVYRVFGREVNIWSIVADRSARDAEGADELRAAAERVFVTIGGAMARLNAERPGGLADADLALALPLLWSNVTGLADQFTGVRQHLHTYTWDQMVRFTARALIRGLSLTEAISTAGEA